MLLAENQDVVLIPHSNAGLYVPALTTQRHVTGYVFVDAVLPAPAGRVPMIPKALYEIIAAKADADGILPPWTAWWDEDISSLFPNAAVREQSECEEPRLPLSYFDGSMSIPSGWDTHPDGYLAFGSAYAKRSALRPLAAGTLVPCRASICTCSSIPSRSPPRSPHCSMPPHC